jgi:hypothetical protein
MINLLDGMAEVVEGWTFMWDGDFELTEGAFDPTLFPDSIPSASSLR